MNRAQESQCIATTRSGTGDVSRRLRLAKAMLRTQADEELTPRAQDSSSRRHRDIDIIPDRRSRGCGHTVQCRGD